MRAPVPFVSFYPSINAGAAAGPARLLGLLLPALLLCALTLLCPAAARAQAPLPSAGEFRVNTSTIHNQVTNSGAVAADAAGNFIVTWEYYHPDPNVAERDIYVQRYNTAGMPQGTELRVNTTTSGVQWDPAVAADPSGNFVVVWTSHDGSGYGVYGQRFNAAGTPQGTEFRVNAYTTSGQVYPSVAVGASGNFVITWASWGQDGSDYGVYAQRYSAAGVPQGSEFRVSSFTTNGQSFPSLAMDNDGDFVITWASHGQDGSGNGVYAQRYNAAGVPQGTEFRVNTYTTNDQRYPEVATDGDGDFLVTWESSGQGGALFGIYAQRYNTAGVPQGLEFQVHTTAGGRPDVAADASGNFVVTWEGGGDIYGQRFNAAGAPQGTEFRVNTTTANSQVGPALALDPSGNFLVAWSSYVQNASDPPGTLSLDAFAQRFIVPPPGGRLLISEFRLSGPAGATDEYVELYNNSDSPFVVGTDNSNPDLQGLLINAWYSPSSGTCLDPRVGFLPRGTVIPARGHYLLAGSGYSLSSSAAPDAALITTGVADIPENSSLSLEYYYSHTSVSLDRVGFGVRGCTGRREGGGLTPRGATPAGAHWAWVRDLLSGRPKDTNDNASDFLFVSTDPSGPEGSRLGAPGPENLQSPPGLTGRVTPSPFAPCVASSQPPNRVRDYTPNPVNNSSAGTLEIRRRFTNNTGANITRLRFRVIDMTTHPEGGSASDLRALTSADIQLNNPCTNLQHWVRGATLEQPSTQTSGGGLNSTLAVAAITSAAPLRAGEGVDVRFLLGVQRSGTYRFRVVAEGLVSASPPLASSGAQEAESEPTADGETAPLATAVGGGQALAASSLTQSESQTLSDAATWEVSGDTENPSADRDVLTQGVASDSYVKGSTPGANYGTVTELQVKRTYTPGNGKGRQAYLRFDTTGVEGTVTRATLRVYARLSAVTAANVNIPLAVFPVSAAWGELTLTWNNKPAPNVPAELGRVTVTDDVPRWYEFDVTAFINQERAAGRAVTGVLLRNMLRGEVGDYFTAVNSREAASNQPQLVIEQ